MGKERGQSVTLVTERCVMRFGDGGWRLTEVAPGIDPRSDVIDRIPFTVRADNRVEIMNPAIFDPAPFDPVAARLENIRGAA